MSRPLLYVAIALAIAVLIATVGGGRVAALDGDGVANLLYLGVLGVLIGAWAIRMPRQNALRNAILWVLIVLGLVVAYALRGDFETAGRRVVSVLSPSTPMTGSDGEGRATVTLSKDASGHFVAEATIAGQPVRFLVDTGATSTVLSPGDAARLGIDPSTLTFSVPVSTANGATRAARATVDDFALGPIRRSRFAVLVASDLAQSLLGMDFLSSLAGYNVRGDTLTLLDR
jgi:aspartyl protease family protein